MKDKPAEPEPKNRDRAYLPTLPEGWTYGVTLRGPRGAHVAIGASTDGEWQVVYEQPGQPKRTTTTDSLHEATRTAAAGVRLLDKVAKADVEVQRAREEALNTLGDPETQTIAAEG